MHAYVFGREQDKEAALKARSKLRNKFTVGIDEDLTKKQQATKSAAWPAFLAARQENKRTFWRGGQLFINGQLHQPPVIQQAKAPATALSATAPVFTHDTSFTALAPEAQA